LQTKREIHLDPVLAYDRIARELGPLSDRRRAYLARIEQLVISEIPQGSRSLLDVGAGDGARASRIAQASGVKHLVLLEPSAEMRGKWPPETRGWPMRAEELCQKSDVFDVITCLWNVLGHIFPSENRIEVLRHCSRLLSPEGLLFIDVNHRYNAMHYGLLPTALRILRDRARPSEKNGDVIVRWDVDGASYTTNGHVFTHTEFCRIAEAAGLTIKKRFTVDYANGKVHQSRFAGNLLYVLGRTKSDCLQRFA